MTNLQAIDLLKGLEQSLDDYCELNDEGKTAFGMAITALELFGISEQLTSAQPKKIRGQWSIKGQAIDTVRGYWAKCSACGHSVFGGGNYCSNCGSYNKGEVNK